MENQRNASLHVSSQENMNEKDISLRCVCLPQNKQSELKAGHGQELDKEDWNPHYLKVKSFELNVLKVYIKCYS